jgi:hypothetical protein
MEGFFQYDNATKLSINGVVQPYEELLAFQKDFDP